MRDERCNCRVCGGCRLIGRKPRGGGGDVGVSHDRKRILRPIHTVKLSSDLDRNRFVGSDSCKRSLRYWGRETTAVLEDSTIDNVGMVRHNFLKANVIIVEIYSPSLVGEGELIMRRASAKREYFLFLFVKLGQGDVLCGT